MSIENLIPFILATTLILIIPGPTIILVVSQAVSHGRASVVPLVAGVLMGDFTAMTMSLLGVGALLSASAILFTVFKWIGVLYLIYLGMKMWRLRENLPLPQCNSRNSSAWVHCRRSFIVTALNPKSIAFFVAFLPQFIKPHIPVLPQLILLGAIFLIIATVNASLYAVFAGRLSTLIRKERVRKWFNRCGGGALIGAGILTAGVQRST